MSQAKTKQATANDRTTAQIPRTLYNRVVKLADKKGMFVWMFLAQVIEKGLEQIETESRK